MYKFCLETLPHPLYCFDILPSDCHLFFFLFNYMRQGMFKIQDDVNAVNSFFQNVFISSLEVCANYNLGLENYNWSSF